jgi:tagatose-6-phosphate ketose/aldose isomerase
MSLFGMSDAALVEKDAHWTAREIRQQPVVWQKVRELVRASSGGAFLTPLLARKDLRVILTGAGTSSFAGDILAPALSRALSVRVEPIATTDLVASPDRLLPRDMPALLVSFARSGDSPESVAAVDLAEQEIRERHHLILTCNPEGALCQRGRAMPNAHVVLLPEEVNDRAFAMTSSFTSMLLCAAGLFGLLPASSGAWDRMSRGAEALMTHLQEHGSALLGGDFARVVFLGSGELTGLARESALKLLELTDGKIVAVHDSPLGFRHGPKSIVDGRTLVVFLLSNDTHARRYELDLWNELRADARAARVVALSASTDGVGSGDDVLPIEGMAGVQSIELAPVLAVFSQLFALSQSLRLGVRPDHPSASGTVNRVVRGVTIHPYPRASADVGSTDVPGR